MPRMTDEELDRMRRDEAFASIFEEVCRTRESEAALLKALDSFVALRMVGKYVSSGDFLVDGEDYMAADEQARAALRAARGGE